MAPTAGPKDGASASAAHHHHGCSLRSDRLTQPHFGYISAHINAVQQRLWDPETNKNGWILLDVAENKLGHRMLLERLEAVKGFPDSVLTYTNMTGMPECKAALAGLLERHLMPGHAVDPNHVVVAAGCGALLDNLFWCICDAGDGVLIPAPYYPAFDGDLQAKGQVQPLPVFLDEGPPEARGAGLRAQLDAAVVAAAARGVAVRALLVTNPNNPTGTIYRDDSIREMLKWCLDSRMHYISDEVYALSTFKPEGRFTSAVSLAQQLLPPPPPELRRQRSRLASFSRRPPAGSDASSSSEESDSEDGEEAGKRKAAEEEAARAAAEAAAAAAAANAAPAPYSQQQVDTYVHQLYGLSKDWCGSGLRVGALYTRNSQLLTAMSSASIFTAVSNHTQWAVAQLLGDRPWVDAFLAHSQGLLAQSYDALAAVLREEKIPFVEAVSGMFVWIDLRKWLPAPKTWDSELAFWKRMCDDCKVILTPGKDCHAPEPGFFRLCFAWVPLGALKEAVRRLRSQVLEAEEGGECAVQCGGRPAPPGEGALASGRAASTGSAEK